ncbi:uncharacterized protein LOC110268661 [Arachis ipaensis]|uniref:uncharacterized protein LOC110268661 n=1 Tax=Arachis ipaensis TaxID=130454 RepID=UPI000A2B4066|nr:uncharacterized protein LOC110268661 [Arachis ipaensis]XP_029146249.1 uncharacterized protein LOC114924818 [Arachis hypogaea]
MASKHILKELKNLQKDHPTSYSADPDAGATATDGDDVAGLNGATVIADDGATADTIAATTDNRSGVNIRRFERRREIGIDRGRRKGREITAVVAFSQPLPTTFAAASSQLLPTTPVAASSQPPFTVATSDSQAPTIATGAADFKSPIIAPPIASS